MSRAMVSEDGLDHETLPELPLSAHPDPLTAAGLAALRTRRDGAAENPCECQC